jgi:phytoene synthase
MRSYREENPLSIDPRQITDLAACRASLRGGSRSFHLAQFLLPRELRASATALYAFCRQADDAIDVPGGSGRCAAALDALHAQLERVYAPRGAAYAGACVETNPAERQFAGVVHQHAVPRRLLEALLQGFAWDAQGRHYESESELIDYAVRVAGTVGMLMSLLMGARTPALLARACDLGVAMQLTNIARDVGEDARLGRRYLPAQWLREAGVDPDRWLAQPQYSAALGAVVERLLRLADTLYARAVAGIARLPRRCRPGIHAARLLYAEIGHELRRRGLDSVGARARVRPARKGLLLLEALRAAARGAPEPVYLPLPEARALIELVARESSSGMAPPARTPSRSEWLLELFVRLQQRDQQAACESAPAR